MNRVFLIYKAKCSSATLAALAYFTEVLAGFSEFK